MNMLSSPILVVVAHPDDETLGFGATSHRLGLSGKKIKTIVLSGKSDKRYLGENEQILEEQCLKACKILNMQNPRLGDFPNLNFHNVKSEKIVEFIEKSILDFKPKTIITHHPSDLNIDHQVASNLCLAAARLSQRRPDYNLPLLNNILFMEVLSSTDWAYPKDNNNFTPNSFCQIDEDDFNAKMKALNIYSGVNRDRPHPRNEETLRAIALYRGSQCGTQFAESFQSCFQYYANK